MTNREWLESLSDEELAIFMIHADSCKCCLGKREKCFTVEQNCVDGKIKWLKAEHINKSCHGSGEFVRNKNGEWIEVTYD